MAGVWRTSTGGASSTTAYHTLRDRILTCELGPGDRLTERQITAELGLGLFPVRDAMNRLVQDGLVQVRPRTGYRVAPLTMKAVDDLFGVWTLLGPEITRLGVTRAGAEQMDALRRLTAELDQVLGMAPAHDRIRQSLALADEMFHLLALASDNPRLLEVYRSLEDTMMRAWSVLLLAASDQGVLQTARISWQQAVDRRDGTLAAEVTRRFVETSRALAVRVLQKPHEHRDVVVPLRP